jgi:hypothetical protein
MEAGFTQPFVGGKYDPGIWPSPQSVLDHEHLYLYTTGSITISGQSSFGQIPLFIPLMISVLCRNKNFMYTFSTFAV